MRDDVAVASDSMAPSSDSREAFEHFVATRSARLLRTAYLLTQD